MHPSPACVGALRNAVSLLRQPLSGYVGARNAPYLPADWLFFSAGGVKNMPWVRQRPIKPGKTTPDGNVSLLTARWRAEAIVNRTGGR